jgi:predicted adenine nucleotide alpha hydrolase (AANH) superfamily ATPase
MWKITEGPVLKSISKADLVLSSAAQKIPLAENRFLQALKRAENTKEKSRRCFICVT